MPPRSQYPKVCFKDVSITVVQSRDHILNTYSEAISRFAEDKFRREGVQVVTNARVASVHPDKVVYTVKRPNGGVDEHTIPTNFVLWSTGIAMNPFTAKVSSLLYVLPDLWCDACAEEMVDPIRCIRRLSSSMRISASRARRLERFMRLETRVR